MKKIIVTDKAQGASKRCSCRDRFDRFEIR